MAGLFNKVTRFARTPQGQQAIRKVQQAAKDPATRRKIDTGLDRLRQQVSRRGGGPGGTGGTTGDTPSGPVPGRPPQP